MADDEEFDFALLPDELQHVAPLIQRFGVGDDLERGKLVADQSSDELRAIVKAASPHWQAINLYLDENMDPPGPRQDVAIALGDFAQAALEAEVVLRSRNREDD